jgi:hypothetical protein
LKYAVFASNYNDAVKLILTYPKLQFKFNIAEDHIKYSNLLEAAEAVYDPYPVFNTPMYEAPNIEIIPTHNAEGHKLLLKMLNKDAELSNYNQDLHEFALRTLIKA